MAVQGWFFIFKPRLAASLQTVKFVLNFGLQITRIDFFKLAEIADVGNFFEQANQQIADAATKFGGCLNKPEPKLKGYAGRKIKSNQGDKQQYQHQNDFVVRVLQQGEIIGIAVEVSADGRSPFTG